VQKYWEKREFCSILCESIRNDESDFLDCCLPIIKGINQLCVDRRKDPIKVQWPSDHTLYRGAGLPTTEQIHFTTIGKKYRCPMFLATSKNKITSMKVFCKRAQVERKEPPILYVFHLDPQFGCVNVNYVDRTNVENEDEFLFVPYSVFTVKSIDWKPNPVWTDPHEVHLIAAIDNSLEPQNLPLILWH